MSATTSATTGRRYGLERVCRMWERSRSALYARRARLQRQERGARPARRGPTPALSDARLLAAIRRDLARSPFQGEGHRKVHARLRILDGVRVARTRVLRVMRAHGLLSPHRGRQGDPQAHDGTIVTVAPYVMWGTDGVRVFTAEDGWVWTCICGSVGSLITINALSNSRAAVHFGAQLESVWHSYRRSAEGRLWSLKFEEVADCAGRTRSFADTL